MNITEFFSAGGNRFFEKMLLKGGGSWAVSSFSAQGLTISTWQKVLPGVMSKNVYFFLLENAFSSNLKTINFKIFCNHSDIYMCFHKKLNKIFGRR